VRVGEELLLRSREFVLYVRFVLSPFDELFSLFSRVRVVLLLSDRFVFVVRLVRVFSVLSSDLGDVDVRVLLSGVSDVALVLVSLDREVLEELELSL
jgi:hypothetical protein